MYAECTGAIDIILCDAVCGEACYIEPEDGIKKIEGLMKMSSEYNVGDIIQTRKQHPCGNDKWSILRIGADFKIKCLNCGRIVMLDRETFLKRVKKVIEKSESN